MKSRYLFGLVILPIFTMHAQDVSPIKQKRKIAQVALQYPNKLVSAEKNSHKFDSQTAHRSRVSSTSSQGSPLSSKTPSPQRSPSMSPRDESNKLEAIHEKPQKQVRVVWQG